MTVREIREEQCYCFDNVVCTYHQLSAKKRQVVTMHEDEIVGPFESYDAAHTWLLSLSGDRGDRSYVTGLSDPVKTKALWAEWDGEPGKIEADKIEAAVTLASENGDE